MNVKYNQLDNYQSPAKPAINRNSNKSVTKAQMTAEPNSVGGGHGALIESQSANNLLTPGNAKHRRASENPEMMSMSKRQSAVNLNN